MRVPRIRNLVGDRDALVAACEQLAADRDRLRAENASLSEALERQRSEASDVAAELERITGRLWVPAEHFYSPMADLDDVRTRWSRIWEPPAGSLAALDIREQEQLDLLGTLGTLYRSQPFPEAQTYPFRYFLDNPRFAYADGLVLHCLIRHLEPRRIIEIGSGWSSCVVLDTNEHFFGGRIECTFIEPYPDVLHSLVTEQDRERMRLIEKRVELVDPGVFADLEPGDILFVDSSHVSKTGSDVNHILFDILPALPDGVVVHFHDIFYPFEYPLDWLEEGRTWTEAYLLRAFLMHNERYQVLLWNDFLARFHEAAVAEAMPLARKNSGGSLWLRKSGRAWF
jgi:methyltransferase family protein